MKYVLTLIITTVFAVVSLFAWAETGPIGPAQIFGAFIMYIAAPQVITWAVSETIKDIRFKR